MVLRQGQCSLLYTNHFSVLNVQVAKMMTERDILLKKLSSVAFAMFEIRLFLDTHPDSTDAMAKFDDLNDKYVKLKEKYEDEYGPLLSKDADSPVQWIKGPWPWEVQ